MIKIKKLRLILWKITKYESLLRKKIRSRGTEGASPTISVGILEKIVKIEFLIKAKLSIWDIAG